MTFILVINRFNSTIDNLYRKLTSNEEVSLEQLKIDMPIEYLELSEQTGKPIVVLDIK